MSDEPLPGECVLVRWVDSARISLGWAPSAKYRALENPPMESVGILVARTDEKVVIVTSQNVGETGHVRDALVIPAGCVRSVRRLA